MYTIVGLGNPGAPYEDTRHNAGRIALRAFMDASGLPPPVHSNRCAGDISEGVVAGTEVRVLFPDTYMNKSGSSVRKVVQHASDELIVVHDDIDLAIGEVKISRGRGSGGHNGIASVIDALKSKDFIRIRIGIAPVTLFGTVLKPQGRDAVSRFVLKPFTRGERKKIDAAGTAVAEALQTILSDGVEKAMNRFN